MEEVAPIETTIGLHSRVQSQSILNETENDEILFAPKIQFRANKVVPSQLGRKRTVMIINSEKEDGHSEK